MAYNPYDPFTEPNPYLNEEQEQPQPGTPPIGGLAGLSSFMPGAGSGGMGGAGSTAGMGGGAAGAGGAGGGSAVATAGPWAALAAIIIGNETLASKTGHRRGKTFGKKHIQDMASTEVLNQDIEGRILPAIGIDEDTKLSKAISLISNPLSLDFGNTWDRIKDIF